MSRARRTTRRRVAKPKVIRWNAEFAELFGMGSALGAAPPTVQVRRTQLGATFVAIFTGDDGSHVRATTRIEIDNASGAMFLVDQKISISARLRGKARAL